MTRVWNLLFNHFHSSRKNKNRTYIFLLQSQSFLIFILHTRIKEISYPIEITIQIQLETRNCLMVLEKQVDPKLNPMKR
ncbi:unnamed protein product [Paramecium octaurelia]|uniref:Uncharacterized protein n=1 Tax=Paramecium octaurelia TaxID=43137 RepID=A0A8S1V520_PAROT|nr:unnamed protein product [Paramecium octaurelia]